MRIRKYKTMLNEDKRATLIMESQRNYPNYKRLDTPDKVYSMLCEMFALNRQTEEYLYLLALDTKNKLIGLCEISHGTVNSSLASPREIFQKALFMNATNIIVAHNHPSGDTTPSTEDINVFNRLKEVGNLMEIRCLDSIIVGDSYCSLTEEGK